MHTINWYGVTQDGEVVRDTDKHRLITRGGAVGDVLCFPRPISLEDARALIEFGMNKALSRGATHTQSEVPPRASSRSQQLSESDKMRLRVLKLEIRQERTFDEIMHGDWSKVSGKVVYVFHLYREPETLAAMGFTRKQRRAINAKLREIRMDADQVGHLIGRAKAEVCGDTELRMAG